MQTSRDSNNTDYHTLELLWVETTLSSVRDRWPDSGKMILKEHCVSFLKSKRTNDFPGLRRPSDLRRWRSPSSPHATVNDDSERSVTSFRTSTLSHPAEIPFQKRRGCSRKEKNHQKTLGTCSQTINQRFFRSQSLFILRLPS